MDLTLSPSGHLFTMLGGAGGLYFATHSGTPGETATAVWLYAVTAAWAWGVEWRRKCSDEKTNKEIDLATVLAGGDAQKREARQYQEVKSNEPPVYLYEKPVNETAAAKYNQTVKQERLQRVDDRERYVARTLVEQESFNGKMNISESFWIREKHWDGSAEDFRAMRLKWEIYKIVMKRNDADNARYEIVNREAVGLIATGRLKLPPPKM